MSGSAGTPIQINLMELYPENFFGKQGRLSGEHAISLFKVIPHSFKETPVVTVGCGRK